MLRVEQLTKKYGARVAVNDAQFSVNSGEIVGFLGPNGAGKSTTLRMVTGFLTPTAGRIYVDGVDAVAEPLEAVKRIGYMPEGVPLYPELRVREYLKHRAELKGVPRASIRKRVDACLEQASVADARDRIIGQLSKGYRQRVGLADALVADPPFLILDEPTSGLDPNQMRQVRDLIRGFAGKKTVLVSTHILPEVEATCTRAIIIAKGHVVAEGPLDELRKRRGAVEAQLTIRGTGAAVEAALASHGAVTGVHTTPTAGELTEVRVGLRDADRAVEEVVAALAQAGLGVRDVRSAGGSLEDVFAALTATDAGAQPEEGGAS